MTSGPDSDDLLADCGDTEIAVAVKRKDVSFSHIVRAEYAHVWVADPELRHCWERIGPDAQICFSEAHDGIQESLFLRDVPGGVMMTGDGSLFAEVWLNRLDYDITGARAFLFDLDVLRKRVDLHLPPTQRNTPSKSTRRLRIFRLGHAEPSDFERGVCLRELLCLYRGLLGTLDNEARRRQGDRGLSEPYRDELAELRRELGTAEKTFIGFLRPRAERNYLIGTLLGVVLAGVLVAALALVLALTDAGGLWVAVAASGAVGALMSVWTRLKSEELQVDVDANPHDLRIAGASRPLVGALSALGLYVFVEAGILPLAVPEDPTEANFLLAAIAFLAGFSERLAADVFGRGAASISTVSRAGN
jgi:hypothetical protein